MAVNDSAIPAAAGEEAGNSISELAALIPGGHLLPTAAEVTTEEVEEEEEIPNDSETVPKEEAGEEEEELSPEEEEIEEEEEPAEGVPESVQKRINKLTAKRKQAEEALAVEKAARAEAEAKARELEGRLAEGKPEAKVAAGVNDPLADATTEEALNARLLEAQRVEDWALANLDGATILDAEGNEQFIEGADVRKYLIGARQVLREGPRKLALIAAQAEDEVLAREINPEMWTPGTEAYTAAQEVLRVFPEMKRIPDYRSFIADWHAGYTARVAKGAAAKAPASGEPGKAKAPKVKLAPGAPKGGAVPKVPGKQVAAEQAREDVFRKGGSQEALESYFSQT